MATELHSLLPILSRLSAERGTRVSLAELAAQAQLSPTHFQRKFARVVGEKPPERKRTKMNYDITQQTTERTTVLYKTDRVEQAEIAKALGQMLPAVFKHATEKGITMVGPPFARYVKWGPGMVTVEAGLPVAEGAEGEGDIAIGVWEAGPAAVTMHTGPYDSLHEAHAALETYLHEQGLEAGGAPREIYVTDPGEVPDPADWKTMVVWPIAAK